MNKFLTALAVGVVLTAGSAQAAAIIDIYTDAGDWVTAAGTPDFIEPFDTSLTGITITTNLASLVVDPTFVGGQPFIDDGFGFNLGNGSVDNHVDASIGITYDTGNFFSLGAEWNLAPYLDGSGLSIYAVVVGEGERLLDTLDDEYEGFWGFVSDTAISGIFIRTAGSLADGSIAERERFSLWDLSIVEDGDGPVTPPSGIPEPATFGIMGLALAGIGLAGRVRRS